MCFVFVVNLAGYFAVSTMSTYNAVFLAQFPTECTYLDCLIAVSRSERFSDVRRSFNKVDRILLL